MTIIETYELLKNRIGWKNSPDTSLVVTAENQLTESGRYFQDEHGAITLRNIYDTIEVENAAEAVFNGYLEDFARQSVIHVISNVFDGTSIRKIDDHLSAFDTAISQRMAIVIIEMILSSTRSNRIERITKEYASKLFFELNGGSGNKNFPKLVGIKQRYEEEILRLRDKFNKGRSLDVHTLSIGYHREDPTLL